MADIRDILEIERAQGPEVTKEAIVGPEKKKRPFGAPKNSKRPEGMAREVFALLYNDKKDAPPLFPTDTGICLIKKLLSLFNDDSFQLSL